MDTRYTHNVKTHMQTKHSYTHSLHTLRETLIHTYYTQIKINLKLLEKDLVIIILIQFCVGFDSISVAVSHFIILHRVTHGCTINFTIAQLLDFSIWGNPILLPMLALNFNPVSSLGELNLSARVTLCTSSMAFDTDLCTVTHLIPEWRLFTLLRWW